MAAREELGRMMTNVPLPGQGLTQDPDSKLPTEVAPELTEINDVVGTMFDDLTSKTKMPALVRVLKGNKGFIDRVASAYIEQGIIDGRWNTDVAHLLVEPVLFTLTWVASQSGAPVTFKQQEQYDSSGLDVLSAGAEEEVEEDVRNLLSGEEG